MTQQTTTRKDGPINYLMIEDHDNRPHWKRYGTGTLSVKFTTHDNARWLSIDTTEITTHDNARWLPINTTEISQKTRSSKRTMATLDEVSAFALYSMLRKRFEPHLK